MKVKSVHLSVPLQNNVGDSVPLEHIDPNTIKRNIIDKIIKKYGGYASEDRTASMASYIKIGYIKVGYIRTHYVRGTD